MTVIDVQLENESQTRYLTYALSVVSSRALPDVRDGLKPVQRRILYAMENNLGLAPNKAHRKSAAVVGEVLARYHPHGDSACYEAMVRMAQSFSLRYPLVDGQGNFGSLDGDAAAAYRYTEARLTPIALEVIGDIGEETVAERDNFDQTVKEPVVLPSRIPNLLVNGASGIAVGMATAIPPHNLKEVIKALLILIEQPDVTIGRLVSAIKGPDFPTGCHILNTPEEIREVYSTGRGPIRMQASHTVEKGNRGKEWIVFTSVPYGIDKSALVEKIADIIISKKLPQVVDVRDESTDDVRIVLELAPSADPEKALAYLFKNTPLQQNFNVNLTALIPTSNQLISRPALLSLKDMLQHFIDFRVDVTRRKLLFEKGKLDDRIHLLEGILKIYDVLDEVIAIVRKSDGRADAAKRLQQRFGLSERQSLFIVDLRIYQLSKTSIEEIQLELKQKRDRVAEIVRILGSEQALRTEVATDLKRISDEYGDARRSQILNEFEQVEFEKEAYVQHEQVWAIVTRDGWLKRIRSTNDPNSTRIREGDALFFAAEADTRDVLVMFSNFGNVYAAAVYDLLSTSGFGEPVQKLFRFQDGEQIAACAVFTKEELAGPDTTSPPAKKKDQKRRDILVFSEQGLGFRFPTEHLSETKKTGKRLMKLGDGDRLQGICFLDKEFVFLLSEQGYGLRFPKSEITQLSGAGKGVLLQRLGDSDRLVFAASVAPRDVISLTPAQGAAKDFDISSLTILARGSKGTKILKKGAASQQSLPLPFPTSTEGESKKK